MSIELGMVAALRADGTVAGLVGTRIYPAVIPDDGALPAIVYAKFDAFREQQLSGVSTLLEARLTLDCWAASYSEAKALADAVRVALEGIGVQSTAAWDGVAVQQVYLDSEQDLSEFEGDRADYRVSQDWIVLHQE